MTEMDLEINTVSRILGLYKVSDMPRQDGLIRLRMLHIFAVTHHSKKLSENGALILVSVCSNCRTVQHS